MNDDVRSKNLPVARVGRRAVLQSLATGVGAVAFTSHALAAHGH